jgi:hypothetical protein
MGKTTGHIIKAHNVKLEGTFHLDLTQVSSSRPPRTKGAPLTAPVARIVESRPEFAVLEITCSCGTKTCLKCEYAGVEAPAGQVTNQT